MVVKDVLIIIVLYVIKHSLWMLKECVEELQIRSTLNVQKKNQKLVIKILLVNVERTYLLWALVKNVIKRTTLSYLMMLKDQML